MKSADGHLIAENLKEKIILIILGENVVSKPSDYYYRNEGIIYRLQAEQKANDIAALVDAHYRVTGEEVYKAWDSADEVMSIATSFQEQCERIADALNTRRKE